jgi:S1-C subfamily serine protease
MLISRIVMLVLMLTGAVHAQDASPRATSPTIADIDAAMTRNDVAQLERWAAAGSALAAYDVAVMSLQGIGTGKNDARALEFLRRADQLGQPDASLVLGTILLTGTIPPRDYAAALRALYNAANTAPARSSSLRFAANYLGWMHLHGQGVASDPGTALAWCRIAAQAGYAENPPSGESAQNCIARIERDLPEAERARAERVAAEWKPRGGALRPTTIAGTESTAPEPAPRGAHLVVRQAMLARLRQGSGAGSGPRANGTGFFVSGQGHVMTAAHVVARCQTARIKLGDQVFTASIQARNERSDLALLKVEHRPARFAEFRADPALRPGESVVVAGFPLPAVLAPELNVTIGNISALAGVRGDLTRLQMSAPTQPANSGGPLFDESANVIGVVVSRVDSVGEAGVQRPVQNANFAVQRAMAVAFMLEVNVRPVEKRSTEKLSPADIGERAKEFTVAIECTPS